VEVADVFPEREGALQNLARYPPDCFADFMPFVLGAKRAGA